MNLLALDTSTLHAAAAVARSDGLVLVAPADPATRHGRRLIPTVRNLLNQAGLAPADLDLLAAGLGPGSYTGLRVGLMAVKALAYATGKPLLGLDSLEAVARNAPDDAPAVVVVADAQRGDLYVADFTRTAPLAPLQRVGPTRIEPADRWRERLAPGTLVLGPALDRPGFRLPDSARAGDPSWNRPEGSRLVGLARDAWAAGRRDDVWALEPIYLRRSAAEDQWDAPRAG